MGAPPPPVVERTWIDADEQDDDREPPPRYDEAGRYIPNEVSVDRRVWSVLSALVLLAWGAYGLWVNDLYIPSKRGKGLHLHDVPAWIMAGAFACAVLVLLSTVADHYDRRENELQYRAFAKAGQYLGWSCFGLAIIWSVFR